MNALPASSVTELRQESKEKLGRDRRAAKILELKEKAVAAATQVDLAQHDVDLITQQLEKAEPKLKKQLADSLAQLEPELKEKIELCQQADEDLFNIEQEVVAVEPPPDEEEKIEREVEGRLAHTTERELRLAVREELISYLPKDTCRHIDVALLAGTDHAALAKYILEAVKNHRELPAGIQQVITAARESKIDPDLQKIKNEDLKKSMLEAAREGVELDAADLQTVVADFLELVSGTSFAERSSQDAIFLADFAIRSGALSEPKLDELLATALAQQEHNDRSYSANKHLEWLLKYAPRRDFLADQLKHRSLTSEEKKEVQLERLKNKFHHLEQSLRDQQNNLHGFFTYSNAGYLEDTFDKQLASVSDRLSRLHRHQRSDSTSQALYAISKLIEIKTNDLRGKKKELTQKIETLNEAINAKAEEIFQLEKKSLVFGRKTKKTALEEQKQKLVKELQLLQPPYDEVCDEESGFQHLANRCSNLSRSRY